MKQLCKCNTLNLTFQHSLRNKQTKLNVDRNYVPQLPSVTNKQFVRFSSLNSLQLVSISLSEQAPASETRPSEGKTFSVYVNGTPPRILYSI